MNEWMNNLQLHRWRNKSKPVLTILKKSHIVHVCIYYWNAKNSSNLYLLLEQFNLWSSDTNRSLQQSGTPRKQNATILRKDWRESLLAKISVQLSQTLLTVWRHYINVQIYQWILLIRIWDNVIDFQINEYSHLTYRNISTVLRVTYIQYAVTCPYKTWPALAKAGFWGKN